MSGGVSKALRAEALEYMRNSRAIKKMVSSGELSQADAKVNRLKILLKLWTAIEKEGLRSRGRPKRARLDIAKPDGMLYRAELPKRPRGRPRADLSWWFELVYETVEEERARLIEQRKNNGSIREAIRSILALRLAPDMGWSNETASGRFESLRADYRRGKALKAARGKSERKA